MLKHFITQELFQVVRFGVIGLGATTIHLSVALSIIPFGVHPLIANVTGFICAFFFSFFGHHYWTFQQKSTKTSPMMKFFTVALIAFLVNNSLLIVIINMGALSKQAAIIIAVLIIPIVTYLASRLWVFK